MKFALCTYCNRCGDAPASIDHGLSGLPATCLLCLCQSSTGLFQFPPGYLLPHWGVSSVSLLPPVLIKLLLLNSPLLVVINCILILQQPIWVWYVWHCICFPVNFYNCFYLLDKCMTSWLSMPNFIFFRETKKDRNSLHYTSETFRIIMWMKNRMVLLYRGVHQSWQPNLNLTDHWMAAINKVKWMDFSCGSKNRGGGTEKFIGMKRGVDVNVNHLYRHAVSHLH